MSTAAIFVDTETTGLDQPDVIQLAYSAPFATPKADLTATVTLAMFQPTKPISIGAMATHHIIPDDLVGFPVWSHDKFKAHDGVGYLVGHNIDFDWECLGKPNLKRICTLALARRVKPLLDSHKLGALIYDIYPPALARNLLSSAHNASVDVDLCARVLFSLLPTWPSVETWEDLWTISEEARIPTHMTFGNKYSPRQYPPLGMPILEMRRVDPGYVRWLLQNADIVKNDPYWQKALMQ